MHLVIDLGNTKAKVAIFEGNELKLRRSWKNLSIERLEKLFIEFSISHSIISSVVDTNTELIKYLERHSKQIQLSGKSELPINIKYKTPMSLGADRIANAVAGNDAFPDDPVLIIDAGTCIKFDFVDKEMNYWGGAISPGISMRYRALNTFTDKLPLIQRSDKKIWLGRTTEESIQCGVEYGVLEEVKGFINRYNKEYDNLKVIVTGGDASFFVSRLKKRIFADPNLLVKGLHIILQHNA